jgi:HK97 family phage prohead protease
MDIERRVYKAEFRKVDIEQPKIIGYGAVFNSISEDLGGFQEVIMPGAFSDTLTEDVRALMNHDANLILGRTIAGTLKLAEDNIGLLYEIDPPETSYAKDLLLSIQRGDIDQSSFGFQVLAESWKPPSDTNPLPIRVLHRVKLFDVSPVTFPAYPTTSVSARTLEYVNNLAQESELNRRNLSIGRLVILRRKLDLLELE